MGNIQSSVVESWNKIQKQLKDMLLKDLSPRKIKTTVSKILSMQKLILICDFVS